MGVLNAGQIDSIKIKKFQKIILDFWKKSGRKHLPWRMTTDPWEILIAEILLRKTTSRQAVAIYERLGKLSPQQVAGMNGTDLEALLRPIGMYRVRARQLRLIAERVAQQGSQALQSPSLLESLPGVGRYIRNAVLCVAFGCAKPALDTNMIRVIKRVFGLESKRSRAREDPELWEFAEALVPKKKCREFNWGVLDLATALCKARNPLSLECPLNVVCDYHKSKNKEKIT
jgi:A/G-specific adenine glycosylase